MKNLIIILISAFLLSCGEGKQKPYYKETKTIALYISDSGTIKYGAIYRVDADVVRPDSNNISQNEVSRTTTYWIPVNDSIWKVRSADSIWAWGLDVDSLVKNISDNHKVKKQK